MEWGRDKWSINPTVPLCVHYWHKYVSDDVWVQKVSANSWPSSTSSVEVASLQRVRSNLLWTYPRRVICAMKYTLALTTMVSWRVFLSPGAYGCRQLISGILSLIILFLIIQTAVKTNSYSAIFEHNLSEAHGSMKPLRSEFYRAEMIALK